MFFSVFNILLSFLFFSSFFSLFQSFLLFSVPSATEGLFLFIFFVPDSLFFLFLCFSHLCWFFSQEGGTSLYRGLFVRLQKELDTLFPTFYFKKQTNTEFQIFFFHEKKNQKNLFSILPAELKNMIIERIPEIHENIIS